MLRQESIEMLKTYFSNKPVIKAYIFGSYSRNEENEKSDIDIILEIDYSVPVSLLDLISWKLELEKQLKAKVDIVSEDGMSKYIKPLIEKDKLLIYERAA
ncbi:MAG: nucleotidyltransferase domain-containing protein [Bacteroidales bacterium]|nr:nucleotidyltransferase domain-containing protein [Bacteroidales bacterium]